MWLTKGARRGKKAKQTSTALTNPPGRRIRLGRALTKGSSKAQAITKFHDPLRFFDIDKKDGEMQEIYKPSDKHSHGYNLYLFVRALHP